MGLPVYYQGSFEHPVGHDFETELVRLASGLGVEAHVPTLRSNGVRQVRGVIVRLGEKVESASLLVSPEGWLLPLTEIEDAERAPLGDVPWVSVKTQYGPIEAHIVLVELLAEVQRRWVPALRVMDEGLYWETRNRAVLEAQRAEFDAAIGKLSAALADVEMTDAERNDPILIEKQVRRAAAKAHRRLRRERGPKKLH